MVMGKRRQLQRQQWWSFSLLLLLLLGSRCHVQGFSSSSSMANQLSQQRQKGRVTLSVITKNPDIGLSDKRTAATMITSITTLFALLDDDDNDEINGEYRQEEDEDDESSIGLSASSSSTTNGDSNSVAANNNVLDKVLSRLTMAFPLYVVGAALLGSKAPSALQWVNRGSLITYMLASVMIATGMTLEKKDFENVLTENTTSVPAGVLCQYGIMPLAAYVVGQFLLLRAHQPHLYLGLVLVGCSPGGTASNLVSLIAGANVALSVLLTACSTILAAVMTPTLVLLLVNSLVPINGLALLAATVKVVLAPVLVGMLLNAKAPNLSQQLSRFTPLASAILVSLICGGVVATNAAYLQTTAATAAATTASLMLPRLVLAVVALHTLGFGWGYVVSKRWLGFSETASRTISIETGMQNSALAVVLAQSVGAPALACLPGAVSATAHSCLGSILAAYWRWKDAQHNDDKDKDAS